jgi:hypothetical protein
LSSPRRLDFSILVILRVADGHLHWLQAARQSRSTRTLYAAAPLLRMRAEVRMIANNYVVNECDLLISKHQVLSKFGKIGKIEELSFAFNVVGDSFSYSSSYRQGRLSKTINQKSSF